MVLPHHTSRGVQKTQERIRLRQLSAKKIHGEYCRQWQKSGGNAEDPNLWLIDAWKASERNGSIGNSNTGWGGPHQSYHKGVLKDVDLADDRHRAPLWIQGMVSQTIPK